MPTSQAVLRLHDTDLAATHHVVSSGPSDDSTDNDNTHAQAQPTGADAALANEQAEQAEQAKEGAVPVER